MVQAPIILIAGPTAVGKSRLAVTLAQRLDAEIINADSQQVYQGCAIGTGTLPPGERQGIPHHLVGVVAPDRPFDAAQFVQRADAAVAEIHARGRRVIMVGGTGLYLTRFVWGLCAGAPRAPAIRAALEAQLAAQGSAALHDALRRCDPAMAETIHPHHSTRIVRALEVWQATGQSIREHWQSQMLANAGGTAALSPLHPPDPRHPVRWIGLHCERAILRERIAARIDAQLAAGWLDEARTLLTIYGPDAAIFRAIGYRELARCLHGDASWEETVARIVLATGQYAKRQMTYLRGIADMTWHDITTHPLESLAHHLNRFLTG